jgi:hypothetical protein
MKIDDAAPPRTSHRLMMLADHPADRVSLGDALAVLGERGFGLLLLVLTLPNAVPVPAPPGVSLVLAMPLILVAAQMVLGLEQPRLPRRLQRLSIPRARLAALLQRALPHLGRIERHLRPRHPRLTDRRAERLLGVACLGLALVLCLPIPMGNAPVAWALVVVALGLLERDGLFALIGLAAGVVAVAWNLALVLVGGSAIAMAAETIAATL